MTRTVAALFVDERGPYVGLEGVDAWGVSRDARLYAGPHPVVAHPPCSRWCRLAGLVQARWGHKKGEDGGCFAAALAAVRRWGGVLEHPAYSNAWRAFDLPRPPTGGGWVRGICGGWSCYVEQGRYGHKAKKATWLYAFGIEKLPRLEFGIMPERQSKALVSWCGNHLRGAPDRQRVTHTEARRTPEAFKLALLQMARSVREVPLGASMGP